LLGRLLGSKQYFLRHWEQKGERGRGLLEGEAAAACEELVVCRTTKDDEEGDEEEEGIAEVVLEELPGTAGCPLCWELAADACLTRYLARSITAHCKHFGKSGSASLVPFMKPAEVISKVWSKKSSWCFSE
jgi:hypothetical protein